MPYTVTETRTYSQPQETLTQAVLGAISGLEGELMKNDPANGIIQAKFGKTILKNTLGDRTQMEIEINGLSASETQLVCVVYPINPVGQKLQFGARKGVSQKVMAWFFAHVEHRLKK